jgi:metal-responsive CopG/Arc/MetJ family transcriptional regulator
MAKARVTVTVDRVLLGRCQRVAREATRSQIFEQALGRWLRDRRRQALEEETERYYASLGEVERAEDAAWASLGSRSLGETWS